MLARASVPFAVLAVTSLAAAQITPGNLVVLRVGDGSTALSNAATAVFLDEYTRTGALVQTVPLPTANNGAQKAVTCSGTASSEGGLTQSVDGRCFVVAGYGANVGGAAVASSASSVVPRVIARIGLDETVDATTALGDAYSANNVRGATSWFGSEFWTAGTASATNNPGVRFVAGLGATTSTQLNATVTNIRRVDFWNGQLYCTSASGTFFGLGTVGTGAPTGSSETISLLPGFPAATGPSPYDFFFVDATTVYVADDRTTTGGGIQKWTANGSTWSLQYTLTPGVGIGCRGLTGFVDGGSTTLFATTTANQLVTVVDTGATAVVSPLAVGATNTALRGVRFVRTPASVTFTGNPCSTSIGYPSVGTAGGEPLAGNSSFQLAAQNAPPSTIVLLSIKLGPAALVGLPVPGAPPCTQIYVLPDVLTAALADAFGAVSVPLPLPAGAAWGGLVVAVQAVVLDPGMLGYGLPIGHSEAMQVTVGN